MMPMGFDQPDNAARAQRLGVARWLSPRRFTGARVARALGSLVEDTAVLASARRMQERVRSADGLALACDALERHAEQATARLGAMP
jgi:UDP:flavonoid glycosyltransferase YjiC (YdhE family)